MNSTQSSKQIDECLMIAPILSLSFVLFVLQADAFDYGLGDVLTQIHEDRLGNLLSR